MITKPITNMFGNEVQLTREEFVSRWVGKTDGFMMLFLDHGDPVQLQSFITEVHRLAGLEWDGSKEEKV
jgi:hypothetical protein